MRKLLEDTKIAGLYAVMILAGSGVILTLVFYFDALLNLALPLPDITGILFPGIFVVWFPTVIVMSSMTRHANRQDVWKVGLSGCPQWMRNTLYTLIACGALNFIWLVVLGGNRKAMPATLGLGGHLVTFYGIAFAIMYSAIHAPALLQSHRCPNSHPISPTDAFCPKCGVALAPLADAEEESDSAEASSRRADNLHRR